MFDSGEHQVDVTLYTDAYVVRGLVTTRHRRLTDVLNQPEHDLLVLSDVTMEEFGSRASAIRSEYAQVNLDAVLFAVAEQAVEAPPEMRTPKVAELAMISVPPFTVAGRIHLFPERDLGEALAMLVGGFIPVTDATYWSEKVAEAKRSVAMVAVNRNRAQILAPYRDVDPWSGLDRGAVHTGGAAAEGASEG